MIKKLRSEDRTNILQFQTEIVVSFCDNLEVFNLTNYKKRETGNTVFRMSSRSRVRLCPDRAMAEGAFKILDKLNKVSLICLTKILRN